MLTELEIKNLLNNYDDIKLSDAELITLMLDITRVIDSDITKRINEYKNKYDVKINSYDKEQIRLYFLGYPINTQFLNIEKFKPKISKKEIELSIELLNKGIEKNKESVINSLIGRYRKNFLNEDKEYLSEYLEYIEELQEDKNQLVILNINSEWTDEDVYKEIVKEYDQLSNYHYMILIFDDNIDLISWQMIANIAVYMENFKLEQNFNVFQKKNKEKRINEVLNFLDNNEFIQLDDDLSNEVLNFYKGVSYGFQFEDLFITDDGQKKILIMQKIELDEQAKKCPDCLHSEVRGNSYSRILYKSFECQNPHCPSRSKNGRGKRYDLFGAKRKVLLEQNSINNKISDDIYFSYRKDIIKNSQNIVFDLIQLYSWENDKVKIINSNEVYHNKKYKGRNVTFVNEKNQNIIITPLSKLPIYQLFNSINKHILFDEKNISNIQINKYEDNIFINENSSYVYQFVDDLKISAAVTSPPYYNAREYSQWPNLICYFCDMMINTKSIFSILEENSTYIYNIGDIVDQDNIYIKSNMSKRRQILSFYSIIIFNIVGYNISTDIIWDKGEVQSKRNSTSNHFSGYLKPVNVYEHNLVFNKGRTKLEPTVVKKIEPVKKINSKGENILGHTAPFPIQIAELILPYVRKNEYILDPFLGSGTTAIMGKRNQLSVIGFEIDNRYYDLAIQRYLNDTALF